ncbi:MAG: hypothetical protein ACOX9R_03540 [Armatimonadota bacterium]|jgi:hypothetical protein
MFEELDDRQMLLGGVTLLLILVHMIFPAAGVDAVSIILLVFFAVVLFGDEATEWLAGMLERSVSAPGADSELRGRVREVGYRVEHARVAASTEGMGGGRPVADAIDRLLSRANGEPRAALMLLGAALEERLRAATGAGDGLQAARQLAERGKVPRQFVEAVDAFRKLRNDVARAGNGEVTDELLWSLVDIGGGLLALIPKG